MKSGFRRDFISAKTFDAIVDIFCRGNTALLVPDTVGPFPSYPTGEAFLLKQGLVYNHQYENKNTLCLTEIAFSCERMSGDSL